MNQGVVWGVVIVLIVVGAGLFWWRSAGPNGEEPVPTLDVMEATESPAPALVSPGTGATVSVSPEVATSPAVETVTISMDETGFTPKTVTVAAGTTVTFVNNGQAPHWPASALHPTHQVLPGFDALRGLATGETYSFAFTKTGSWNCHDHLNPQSTCTIVVE